MAAELNNNVDLRLEELYTNLNQPTAFRGKTRLKNKVRGSISGNDVDKWLRKKDYYTIYKRAKQRFPRRPIIVSGDGVTLQADLLDMQGYSSLNEGFGYLLTTVDAFSRFARVKPLKRKTGVEVAAALQQILDGTSYQYLQTDKGREFYNPQVSRLLRRKGITHYSSEDDRIKASMVERFNQTLRTTLHRFMSKRRKKKYIDILETVVETYNNTAHGREYLIPTEVNNLNSEDVWLNRYESHSLPIRSTPKLSVGDYVRVASYRGSFARGYDEFWTREVFRITKVLFNENPVVYTIEDLMGESVQGTYYEDELQLIEYNPDDTFEIEKVIKSRRRRGVREVLVKWLGYPEKFNQWIPANSLSDE